MSKVLISFLGTGALLGKDTHNSLREYRVAKYKLDNKIYERAFMADVLADHFDIDRIILIGTVKSMWEAVYASFYKKKMGHCVEDNDTAFSHYADIAACCEKARHESELYLPHQEEIEQVLGEQSKIVLIKYGVNEEELNENITRILNIEQFLQPNDELIVDITHAFRSLPMLLMNTLIYLQNVSKKHVSISNILYGMLETTSEFGFTPIVDLKKIMEVNEWISAAYSFSEFGNAYKIARLLEKAGNKSEANILRDFSDMKNLNHVAAIEGQVQRLKGIKGLSPIAEKTILPVINDVTKILPNNKDNKHSAFQLNLAKWHSKRHNLSSAYLSLVEAIITHVCEEYEMNYNDNVERNSAKDLLMKGKVSEELKSIYVKVNENRKSIAHEVESTKNAKQMIDELDEGLKATATYFSRPKQSYI